MDKNIAAILREDTKTISVQFFSDKSGELGAQPYTYVTDIQDLSLGDLVVVKVGETYKVVMVMAIHDDLAIEPNSDFLYKWIVSKVDTGPYLDNMRRNKILEETLGKAYHKQMRRSFADTLLNSLPEAERNNIAGLLGAKSHE